MELIVDRVSHAYGALPVLDGVNLRVGAGEIVVIVGPSGCGKSTLLGIVGGLLRPTGGSVATAGAVPADSLNPFTFVFQDFALLPWRSVEGNIALPLEHHKLDAGERRARVDEALRRTGLGEFRAAFPKQLSGGMRQRVGIARALVVRPAVLLMDEPLSALDAQTRELLMEDFLALWLDRRVAALYVTHNLNEALRLADRIVVLSRRPGRVQSIVPVGIPQRERGGAAAQAELTRLRAQLWQSIRDEAMVADREIIDA
ncbi:MAG TPA: ABC transporter ATP-binding protein [Stellaceae bacterium]|nr:ABC transporter ATP-binding protein [Stellaceae bacterium]